MRFESGYIDLYSHIRHEIPSQYPCLSLILNGEIQKEELIKLHETDQIAHRVLQGKL
jgi:hypothetical protein